MSDLADFEIPLASRTVLVTGHTGFTGGWACLWLKSLGARVVGYALPPPTAPSLFEAAGISADVESHIGDILDFPALLEVMRRTRPDLVLHLAAQPLVRRSYREPLATFAVNAMGTANVLEACRLAGGVRGVVCVTTDKVYRNREGAEPFREDDELGGGDPYSASKAAAEMIIDGYRASYPGGENGMPFIATARGGNIIGGGDWAEDRLIPDFVKAATCGKKMTIRYPDAVRPWQHVLGLVNGYLLLLSKVMGDGAWSAARAWNFGPITRAEVSVREVVEGMLRHWPGVEVKYGVAAAVTECGRLALDSSRAMRELGWSPCWTLEKSVAETILWYRRSHSKPGAARMITLEQIAAWRGESRTLQTKRNADV